MALLAIGLAAGNIGAADHLDAPLVQKDGRTDINDVYAFQSPTNPDNTVFIMTVNPLAGVLSPITFADGANYEFLVDKDGDARRDTTIRFNFKTGKSGQQAISIRVTDEDLGTFRLANAGLTGEILHLNGMMKDATVIAGVFDDPFYFDLVGFRNFQASGDPTSFCSAGATDFFAGANVSAIVLELPSSVFGTNNIGVYARTTKDGKQVDRMGRPAINTVFIPSSMKDAFNAGSPRNDRAAFGDEVVATLRALGNDQATAEALASVLLPDILTIDTASSAGFLNGRAPANDVIDAELGLISGGAIPTDCIDSNDLPFPSTFPYLAPAH
jgi:hypothetical protein